MDCITGILTEKNICFLGGRYNVSVIWSNSRQAHFHSNAVSAKPGFTLFHVVQCMSLGSVHPHPRSLFAEPRGASGVGWPGKSRQDCNSKGAEMDHGGHIHNEHLMSHARGCHLVAALPAEL